MPVVMILVGVVVLVGVFFVATGRGGELAYEHGDYAPLDLGPVSATDVALLRPPTALWGYNTRATDEALERIALAIRERDVRIAYLQQQLADLTPETAPMPEVPRGIPEVIRGMPEIPRPHLPQHARPGRDNPAGQDPAAQSHRDQDDPAGPAAAPAAEEQNR